MVLCDNTGTFNACIPRHADISLSLAILWCSVLPAPIDTTYCWDLLLCEDKSLKNKVRLWYWGAAQASVFKELPSPLLLAS